MSYLFSYVGNLDRRCTEQFIEDIFSKCGKVVRCKMINAVGIYLLPVNSMLFDLEEGWKCRPAGANSPKYYTNVNLFHLLIKLASSLRVRVPVVLTLSYILCYLFVDAYNFYIISP